MKPLVELFNALYFPISPDEANKFIASIANQTIDPHDPVAKSDLNIDDWKDKWTRLRESTSDKLPRAQSALAERRANEFFKYCGQIRDLGHTLILTPKPADGGTIGPFSHHALCSPSHETSFHYP